MNLPTVLGARGLDCVLHKYHYPAPARPTVDHHRQPKFMHGPDVPANLFAVCPTGHDNVHLYLDWMLKHDVPTAPHLFVEYTAPLALAKANAPVPRVTRSEKAMALEGYTAWVNMGRPVLLALEAAA